MIGFQEQSVKSVNDADATIYTHHRLADVLKISLKPYLTYFLFYTKNTATVNNTECSSASYGTVLEVFL